MKYRNLKYLILAASTTLMTSFIGEARAQDETYNWSGFYAGFNGGFASGNPTGDYLTIPGPNPYLCFGPAPTCPKTPDLLGSLNGAVGGIQAAYLLQEGKLVYGAEASIQFSNAKAKDNGFLAQGVQAPDSRIDQRLDYYGTIAARIGMAFDRTQVYASGGLAYGKSSVSIDIPFAAYSAKTDYSSVGWTAGAGIEYALTDKISIGGRYDYVSLKSSTQVFDNIPTIPVPVSVPAGDNFSTFRAVVNFKF